MKSMFEGLDLSLTKHLVPYGAFYTVGYDYAEKLLTALEAALRVIEAIDESDMHMGSVEGFAYEEYKVLETALEPFRVVGADTKDGAK